MKLPSELVVFINEQMEDFKKLYVNIENKLKEVYFSIENKFKQVYFSIEKENSRKKDKHITNHNFFFLANIGMLKPLLGIPNP